jgi:hypothetical protein
LNKAFGCLLFLCSLTAYGWSEQGHYLIAEIAYQNLSPRAKEQVDSLFQYLNKIDPPSDFVKSAYWADQIKRNKVQVFNRWHYIRDPIKGSSYKYTPKVYPPNVVSQSVALADILKSKDASNYNKAWSLRLLIHLIGDLHQPTHVATLYSHKFYRSDINAVKYRIRSHYKNLHRYWDLAGGLLKFRKNKTQNRQKLLSKIMAQEKNQYHQIASRDYKNLISSWQKQAYLVAKDIVYTQPYGKKISKDYCQKAQKAASKQLYLAGMDLAQLLNVIYP